MNAVFVTHLTSACWPELTALVTLSAHGGVSFTEPCAAQVPVICPSWWRLTTCHTPLAAKNILSALLEGWPSGTGWRLASTMALVVCPPPCLHKPMDLSHLSKRELLWTSCLSTEFVPGLATHLHTIYDLLVLHDIVIFFVRNIVFVSKTSYVGQPWLGD